MTQSRLEVDSAGVKRWLDDNHFFHREDGPAVEHVNGYAWWNHGNLHRVDGPAVERYNDKYRAWYVNGKCHRLDGPAVEYVDGLRHWYINGKYVLRENFPKAVVMFLFNCDEQTAQLILDVLNDTIYTYN
jgi:hypothetical protein